jgi:hypothetical protein
VTLAGSVVQDRCHACAFFVNAEEEYDVLFPFLKEGLAQRHKFFQILDGRSHQDRVQRAAALGIDVREASRSGQLETRRWEETYVSGGRFDQRAMMGLLEEVLLQGHRDFGLTRIWANMEWALDDAPGSEDVIEYECRVNEVLDRFDDVVVCAYDFNRFSGAVLMDVLRTHPQMIVDGTLRDNPFFVEPATFLRELERRKTPLR